MLNKKFGKNQTSVLAHFQLFFTWEGGDLNPHDRLKSTDFKSVASTIPPHSRSVIQFFGALFTRLSVIPLIAFFWQVDFKILFANANI